MWIAPAARGAGVARWLLGELERTAREAGAVFLRLETNRALSEAIALYFLLFHLSELRRQTTGLPSDAGQTSRPSSPSFFTG
jgi:GNAT superfamily N-acetyltransferase